MRELSMPVRIFGVLTTVLLLVVVNPWFQIPDDQAALRDLVTTGSGSRSSSCSSSCSWSASSRAARPWRSRVRPSALFPVQ